LRFSGATNQLIKQEYDKMIKCTVKRGGSTIKQADLTIDQATDLLLHAHDDAGAVMLAFSTLKRGNTYKFKSDGYSVTYSTIDN